MNKIKIQDQKWFPNAISIVIGVVVFVALTNLSAIRDAIATLFNIIYPLVAGAAIAYLINPLMRFFERKVFQKIRKPNIRKTLALVFSIAVVVISLTFMFGTLIPQIYESVTSFVDNIDDYILALDSWMQNAGVSGFGNLAVVKGLITSSKNIVDSVAKYVSEHRDEIENIAKLLGGHITAWGLGLILAVYFLANKEQLKALAKALLLRIKKDKAENIITFLQKCDEIMSKYIVYSIIEAIIVGCTNAVIMWLFGMDYIGLVSFVVGVTNLIPAFGPAIGAIIGGFVLVLVNPFHSLIFLILTAVLQTIDGYILKPKLFGETFGVSGLWILIAIIIGGRIAGMIGILLSIPVVAIIDLSIRTWKDYSADTNHEVNK